MKLFIQLIISFNYFKLSDFPFQLIMASATLKHHHHFFAFYDFYFVLDNNPRQKWLGRLYNLTVVHFNPKKKSFLFCSILLIYVFKFRTNLGLSQPSFEQLGPGVLRRSMGAEIGSVCLQCRTILTTCISFINVEFFGLSTPVLDDSQQYYFLLT